VIDSGMSNDLLNAVAMFRGFRTKLANANAKAVRYTLARRRISKRDDEMSLPLGPLRMFIGTPERSSFNALGGGGTRAAEHISRAR
jgi:hypothetical protein